MNKSTIAKSDTLDSEAIRSLSFYSEEIKLLQQRLDEVAKRNNSFESRQGIEHFQNQFDIQQHNIYYLKRLFNDHVKVINSGVKEQADVVSQEYFEMESKLYSEFTQLKKVLHDLRQEFKRFLSQWM